MGRSETGRWRGRSLIWLRPAHDLRSCPMPMPSAWWTVFAAAAAMSAPEGASWYLILAGSGATIGHSSQRTVASAGGRELIDDSEIRLQEAGDPATTITDHDVVRQDAQGRTVA